MYNESKCEQYRKHTTSFDSADVSDWHWTPYTKVTKKSKLTTYNMVLCNNNYNAYSQGRSSVVAKLVPSFY